MDGKTCKALVGEHFRDLSLNCLKFLMNKGFRLLSAF